MRLFHDLTGLSAVTSIGRGVDVLEGSLAIAPPVHPRCAAVLRTNTKNAPCEEEWQNHVRVGLRGRQAQSHVCSLGLRCSSVPIFYGETLVGIAKFVADARTEDRRVALAVRALELAVSQVCQESYLSALSEERNVLRRQVAELQRIAGHPRADADDGDPSNGPRLKSARTAHKGPRVEEVLKYVDEHYLDPGFSLAGISRALGLSGKYITHLFTRVVGQRMHAYVVSLRVQHACRQLLLTRKSIKELAYESGFRQPDRFRRAFHRYMGVAPSTYREIFART